MTDIVPQYDEDGSFSEAFILSWLNSPKPWLPEEAVALAHGHDPALVVLPGSEGQPELRLEGQPQEDLETLMRMIGRGIVPLNREPGHYLAYFKLIGHPFEARWAEIYKGSDPKRSLDELATFLRKLRKHIVTRENLIERWAKAPIWTIEEGIALAYNLDPEETIGQIEYGPPFIRGHEVANLKLKHALSGVKHLKVRSELPPRDLIDWLKTIGVEFDEAWHKVLPQGNAQARGVEPMIERHAPDQPETERARRYARMAEDKVRDSLLRLVIGMAKANYGYDPEAKKNAATNRIQSDLALQGINMSDETIRKYLKQGADLILRDADRKDG